MMQQLLLLLRWPPNRVEGYTFAAVLAALAFAFALETATSLSRTIPSVGGCSISIKQIVLSRCLHRRTGLGRSKEARE